MSKSDTLRSMLATGKRLQPEEVAAASAHERILAIGPYLVGMVAKSQKRLNARQRANFSEEDCLAEVYAAIYAKSDGWDAERGAWITYANAIARNCLIAVRDRSSTIQSPANSSGRLKKIKAKQEAGEASRAEMLTAYLIERSSMGVAGVSENSQLDIADTRVVSTKERLRAEIKRAQCNLDKKESNAIDIYFGFTKPTKEQKRMISQDQSFRAVLKQALANLREKLGSGFIEEFLLGEEHE